MTATASDSRLLGPGPSDLERRLTWVVLGTALVLFWALCWPMFSGRVYLNNDLLHQFLPMRAFYADALRAGDAPYWWPNLFGGFYLHGEGQGSLFHPLIWLLYGHLPLTAAFALELLVWYPVAFGGFYVLFGRRLELGALGALVGATLSAFSIFALHRLVHPNALGIMAHAPWLMVCADILVTKTGLKCRLGAACGFAVLTGSCLLLGYPQYLFFAMLLVGALLLHRAVRRELKWAGLFWLGGALALGAALGAIQLLPTQAALAQSVRARPDLWDPSHAFDGSTDPRHLLSAVSPYSIPVSHKQRIYAGAVPLVLALLAFLRIRKGDARRGLVIGLVVLTVLSIWLATGSFGKLYALQTKLPFIDKFRFPSRYFWITHLALAGLSALALMSLVRDRSVMAWRKLWPLAVIAVLALVVTGLAFARKGQTSTEMPVAVVLGGVTVVVACLLGALAARGQAWALLLLLPLYAVDAIGYGVTYHQPGRLDTALSGMPQPIGPLTSDRVAAGRNDALAMRGWHVLDGVAGLDPVKRLDYRHPDALAVAGVAWIVPDAIDASDRFYAFYETTPLIEQLGLSQVAPGVFRLHNEQPRARLVPTVQISKDPAKDIDSVDLVRVALVDAPLNLPADLQIAGGEPGVVSIERDRPGSIVVVADAPTPQLLVLTESFDPGWTASIDGEALEPVAAYGDLLALPVPASAQEVHFEFQPPGLARGKQVSLAAFAVLALAALCALVLHLRARPAPSQDLGSPS